MITFLASILIWLMFFGLLVLWVIDGKIKKEIVIHAVFAALIAWILTEVIKNIVPSVRPFHLNGFDPLTLTIPQDASFPSTHTAAAFAMSLTVFFHDKKVGFLYLVMAALVGIARIIAQVHYPTDIIAGALIGTIISYISEKKHLFKILG